MHPIAFVVGVVAAVLFGVECARARSLVAWGLCCLAVCVLLAFTLAGEPPLTLGA